MTIEQLRTEAEKLGYVLRKAPDYDCSCYAEYPNRGPDGKRTKCDNYVPTEWEQPNYHSCVTHCRRKDGQSK